MPSIESMNNKENEQGLPETRAALNALESEIAGGQTRGESAESHREGLSEADFNNLQEKQKKEQLTDHEYEAMLNYTIEHNIKNTTIIIPNKISKNLLQKIKEREYKKDQINFETKKNLDINLHLIVTPKVIKDRDLNELRGFINLTCQCNYPEIGKGVIEEIKNIFKKGGMPFLDIKTEKLTSEQFQQLKDLKLGQWLHSLQVSSPVSADLEEQLLELKGNSGDYFNSPELVTRTADFIKATMESYLTTKRQNNRDLDRTKDRNLKIGYIAENEQNLPMTIMSINSWGYRTSFTPDNDESYMSTRLPEGRTYKIPMTFPKNLQTALFKKSRNNHENIQAIQAATEIANLTNKMIKDYVLKTETKGCALKYNPDGSIRQEIRRTGIGGTVEQWAFNAKGGVEILSKDAITNISKLRKEAGCNFKVMDFVNRLNKMKYDQGMITEEELQDQLGSRQYELYKNQK